jgi:hypothetical protein
MISSLLAASGALDFGQIFTSLALVLILAKLAAELCERIRIPAVLGEIVAGIIIGPSVLGIVEPSDALRVLAEVGVIILLAEVGLEMDLKELRRVGRASMFVAILGVVLPMSSGVIAGQAFGESLNASLFLGAALAATSVGITARVFGDLKALASTEARIVLGAAVADDVLGLIILTVVTRIVKQGSIDAMGLISTIGLAVGFLVIAGAIGFFLCHASLLWWVPKLLPLPPSAFWQRASPLVSQQLQVARNLHQSLVHSLLVLRWHERITTTELHETFQFSEAFSFRCSSCRSVLTLTSRSSSPHMF